MKKRIFSYMFRTVLLTLLLGSCAVMLILYNYFGRVQLDQLRTESKMTAEAVEKDGLNYLYKRHLTKTRITWIAADGTVIYDNQGDASKMGNHGDRPEVVQALKEGIGESSRYSETLSRQMLYNARKLPDGTVIRLSEGRDSVLRAAFAALFPMTLVLAVLLLISWFYSSRMSRKIVQPINSFDLDHPLENEEYPELSPFAHRIYEQQKQIQQQKEHLYRSEKSFVSVTDNMKEGLILLNPDGRILTINRPAMALLNTTAGCVGKDILYLERRIEFEKALDLAAKGNHQELILSYSGRSYQMDITPVYNNDSLTGMVLLLFDVTDRIKAEQMRKEFSANVSHELKTPLHTISGCAELLESGEVKPEDTKKFIHTIYTQAHRMIDLVQDILYISHLDEGAQDLKWEKTDLMGAVKKAVDQLTPTAAQRGIRLYPTGLSSDIDGIPRLVESIVYNLIDNAIKYNHNNGAVYIALKNRNDSVVLTVEDTGIGIPEEDQYRIFERFYRVDKSHSREIGGTGLGLSIVKHACQILHAKIRVDSTLGDGSTFTVTFLKDVPEDLRGTGNL